MHYDFLIPVLYTDFDIDFYDGLATELERLGRTVGLVALTRKGERRLRARHPHVFYLYEGWRPSEPAPSEIAAIEARYRLGSIADHVYPEHRYSGGQSIARLTRRAVFTFRWLEAFLDGNSVSLFVNNIGSELIRRTMARTAGIGGPPNVILDFAPFHGRVALTTDEIRWDDLPPAPPPLSSAQREHAEKLVAEVLGKKKMFGVVSYIFHRHILRRAWDLSREMLWEEDHPDFSLAGLYAERAQWMARRMVNRWFYQQPIDGEPYLFFPLHIPADTAITVRAPQFYEQENLLEYLARRVLPSGMSLYVKPHPGGIDRFSVPMLARIRRLPRVRLLEPTLNSHRLIEGSRGVVVINSTAGFESLFYAKPVVVLGRVFYRGFGVTTDVENLADLGRDLRAALEHPPEREAILRFLHACWNATSPGAFGDPSPQNLELVARALVGKAERLGVRFGQSRKVQNGNVA